MENLYLFLECYIMLFLILFLDDSKIKVQDCFLIVVISIFCFLSYQFIGIYSSITVYTFLVGLAFYKTCDFWLSIVFSTIVYTLAIIFQHISIYIFSLFGLSEQMSFAYIVISLATTFIPTYFTIRIIGHYFTDNFKRLKSSIFIGVIALFVSIVFFINIYIVRIDEIELDNPLLFINIMVFVVFIIISLLIITVHLNTEYKKNKMRQTVIDYNNLKRYTLEIENQYNNVRKFRHDYQNIFLSLDHFFVEEDYQGLKSYYENHFKKSFENNVNEEFKLENLGNIQIKEIKSILANKLINAMDLGIDTNFEALEVVDDIDVDPIYLIRMLGIILDNAIEELSTLENGTLNVAVFYEDDCLVFIVENNCHKDIDKLYVLKKDGYTSKDNHSGIGLSLLDEIIKNNHNLLLETTINDCKFIQRITIVKEGENLC